jgi:hypothetical protein
LSTSRNIRLDLKTIMPARRLLLLSFLTLCFLLLTWISGLSSSPYNHPLHQDTAQLPSPSPTYDPLAIPTLPANPTQFDIGKNLYYYHCMPCHGDTGQGLTDAWRMVWEEDHRNCWGRGCHGGRPNDEGFPIPTIIPAIIAPTDLLIKYPDLQSLVSYLHDTHPPQRPGKLNDDEYQALAIFMWVSNSKPLPASTSTGQPSPASTETPPYPSLASTHQASPTASPLPAGRSTTLPSQNPAAHILDARLLGLAAVVFLIPIILIIFIMNKSHRHDRL